MRSPWWTPQKIIITGFFMVLFGAVVPFLIVLQILPSTFFLNFLSYTVSIGGLFLGLIGTAMYVKLNKEE